MQHVQWARRVGHSRLLPGVQQHGCLPTMRRDRKAMNASFTHSHRKRGPSERRLDAGIRQ